MSLMRAALLETLLDRLESEPRATLEIDVDHGDYCASFRTVPPTVFDVAEVEGDVRPNLTDALVSLLAKLPIRTHEATATCKGFCRGVEGTCSATEREET
jgi:hypothetical protein